MNHYDYLIVGAGLYGAVFAQEAKKAGKTCLVIDKRGHIAGNIYTEEVEGIQVHRYGAHIFHTSSKAVWQYVNQFAEFIGRNGSFGKNTGVKQLFFTVLRRRIGGLV